jgi:hypothetical protein
MYVVARGYWCLSHFQHEFRYIVMLSLIGGGNGSAGKKHRHYAVFCIPLTGTQEHVIAFGCFVKDVTYIV